MELDLETSTNFADRLAKVILRLYHRATEVALKDRARGIATRALARVINFERTTGKWPKSLAEAGITDADPFSKKKEPLLYKLTQNDVRVHSRGEDGSDEGGLWGPELGSRSKATDLVVLFKFKPRTTK